MKSQDSRIQESQDKLYREGNIAEFANFAEKTYAVALFLAKFFPVPLSPKVPISPKMSKIAENFRDFYYKLHCVRHE